MTFSIVFLITKIICLSFSVIFTVYVWVNSYVRLIFLSNVWSMTYFLLQITFGFWVCSFRFIFDFLAVKYYAVFSFCLTAKVFTFIPALNLSILFIFTSDLFFDLQIFLDLSILTTISSTTASVLYWKSIANLSSFFDT